MRLSRLLVVLAAGASVLAVGCGGSHHTVAPGRGFPAGLARAGCSTAVAGGHPLKVRTSFLNMNASPFGIAVTSDGRWSFVDELSGVAVLSGAGFRPRFVRTVAVPENAVGNSLTADGRYLLIADGGDGAMVVSVQRAETGSQNAVLGTLTGAIGPGPGGGGIEVVGSPDGHYAFVSLEDARELAVYDLRAALDHNFRKSSYVGAVPVGVAPVGMAVSPGGRWLYATSEAGGNGGNQGTLSLISIAAAEHDPAHAVIHTVLAHCSPVRVVVSPDGSTVWVTARESDQLLAFSAAKLRTDPAHALLAAVRVGEAPVGLALVNHGHDLVVADSNRFDFPGAHAQLTVVSAAAALDHTHAIIGTIPTGAFPREMALEPGGTTLLVGDFDSDQLEAVGVGSLR